MNWMPNDFMQGSGFSPFGQMPMMPQQGFPPMQPPMPPQIAMGGMPPQQPPMPPQMPPMQPPMQQMPQQMPQMPPMPMKQLGGLLKAAGDRPGYLNPIAGKPHQNTGAKYPTMRTLAVRG